MNRTEFLETVWLKYPPAQKGAMSVGDYLREPIPGSFVCGRLLGKPGAWQLVSEDSRISVSFTSTTEWLETRRKPCKFEEQVLRAGDIVGVVLHAGHSERIQIDRCSLLVPSQKDYADNSDFTIERSRQWVAFLAEVRTFFNSRRFIEALTPILVPSPGTEPFLDPFVTSWDMGSTQTSLYLPTSPEFHLKKMLVKGWTRVFEFKTCFRNGEISSHHQPEFQMLEWYRAYSDLDAIADDVEGLLEALGTRFGIVIPRLKRTTMASLFEQKIGFHLTPTTSKRDLQTLASRLGVSVSDSDSWDDVFFRIFLDHVEPGLGNEGPLLVRGYPPSQAALSRIGDDGFADRFEVYWKNLELANAFHELNDPQENEARFREDALKKVELGKPAVPVDEELIKALYHGLPPSGGIALGLDRLFMALFGIEKIENARAFPIQHDV